MNSSMVKKHQILIVDDSSSVRTFFKSLLQNDYNVAFAESGEKALKLLGGPIKPEIILLDINMPGMDGFEVCKQLKAQEDTKNIPVIFVTGSASHEEETQGFEVGCVDFVAKPPNPLTVLARVATHLKLAESKALLQQKNQNLQGDLDIVRKAQEVMDYERATVESILEKMRQTASFNDEKIRFLEQPLESATGDILMSCNRPSGVRHILLGDFTGHGLSAALAGPLASDIFYIMTAKGSSPDQILLELNQKLFKKLPSDMYMAGALVEINPSTNSCSIWNGGLPHVLVFDGRELVQEVNSHHVPLGVISNSGFDARAVNVDLAENTRIFAYSDGIVEINNESGEMFGNERLINSIGEMLTQQLPLSYLLEQAKEFQGNSSEGLADDVTLVEISC